MRYALLLAALLPASHAQAQQIYKWVDAQGRTHYGEKPADGTPATPIAAPTPPSTPGQAAKADRWKEAEIEARNKRQEKERAEQSAKAAAGSEERKQQCASARREMDILERQAPVYSRDSRGERVYLTDEQRAAELKELKQKYRENCT